MQITTSMKPITTVGGEPSRDPCSDFARHTVRVAFDCSLDRCYASAAH